MKFLRKLFGRADPTPSGKARAGPPDDVPPLCGPPESDAPIVMVPHGGALMMMDRMAYEHGAGKSRGTDPRPADLAALFAGVDRVRVLDGGMYRDRALGTQILALTSEPEAIRELAEALAIEDRPGKLGHCACLGAPTIECYRGPELAATLGIHHGRSLRWHGRWRHDAPLRDGGRLAEWLAALGVPPGRHDNTDDPMSTRELGMDEGTRHTCRADSHAARGEIDAAEAELALAAAAAPGLPMIDAVRGQILQARGDLAGAVAALTAAIDRGVDYPMVYYKRALIHDALGELEEAVADCTEALARAPEFADGYNSRALVLSRLGRLDEAIADATRASHIAPSWYNPRWQRAMYLAARGDHLEAVVEYTRLIELLHPQAEVIRRDTAELVAGAGDDRIAIAPTPAWCRYLRAKSLAVLGRFDEGWTDVEEALELDPANPLILTFRGQLRLARGEGNEAALADFGEAIRLRPTAELLAGRAQILAGLGRFDEALADLEAALGLAHGEPGLRLMRCQVFLAQGRPDAAEVDCEAVLASDPANVAALYLRAFVARRRGRPDRQLADLARAAELDPDNPGVRNSLAWLLATHPDAAIRDADRAVAHARRLLEILPAPPAFALDTAAAAFAEAGDFAEARRLQERAIDAADDPAKRAEYRGRLSLYRAGRPYHDAPGGAD